VTTSGAGRTATRFYGRDLARIHQAGFAAHAQAAARWLMRCLRDDRRRRSGGHYRRTDETHIIRVFERARVLNALRRAGFTARTLRGYGDGSLMPGRTVFVARGR
jgi:hypothetical protein